MKNIKQENIMDAYKKFRTVDSVYIGLVVNILDMKKKQKKKEVSEIESNF